MTLGLARPHYFDEESNRVTGIQVHPDAASMEFHMKVVGEHIRTAYDDYLESTEGIEIYGQASEGLVEGVRQASPPRNAPQGYAAPRGWVHAH